MSVCTDCRIYFLQLVCTNWKSSKSDNPLEVFLIFHWDIVLKFGILEVLELFLSYLNQSFLLIQVNHK